MRKLKFKFKKSRLKGAFLYQTMVLRCTVQPMLFTATAKGTDLDLKKCLGYAEHTYFNEYEQKNITLLRKAVVTYSSITQVDMT